MSNICIKKNDVATSKHPWTDKYCCVCIHGLSGMAESRRLSDPAAPAGTPKGSQSHTSWGRHFFTLTNRSPHWASLSSATSMFTTCCFLPFLLLSLSSLRPLFLTLTDFVIMELFDSCIPNSLHFADAEFFFQNHINLGERL